MGSGIFLVSNLVLILENKSKTVNGIKITSGLPLSSAPEDKRRDALEVLRAMKRDDSFDVKGSKSEVQSIIARYRHVGLQHKIYLTTRRQSERGETENVVYRVWRI